MSSRPRSSLEQILVALRAAGEETRLRMLALLSGGELSVSDLTDILGQSQPRISRHLKLLVESGLVERSREGAWAFFRLSGDGAARRMVTAVLAEMEPGDARVLTDRERLAAVRAQRAASAEAFFARLAPDWDRQRSLYVSEQVVEVAVLAALGGRPVRSVLDLGTGTGRMLQVLAPQAERLVGLDSSHAMLAVARANLERAGLARAELRQGDIYAPPLPRGSFDLVLIHQVLHFLEDPARALVGAARLVAPGGRLLVIDFAPHALDFLRESGHRRLGFAGDEVRSWLGEAGLGTVAHRDLPADDGPEGLTVSLWLAQDTPAEVAPANLNREVA